jgi:hypothetical protein
MKLTYNQPMFGCPMYLVHRLTLVDVLVTGWETQVSVGEQTRMVLSDGVREFFVSLLLPRLKGETPDKVLLRSPTSLRISIEKTMQALFGKSSEYAWYRASFLGLLEDLLVEGSSVYSVGKGMLLWVLEVLRLEVQYLEYAAVCGERQQKDPTEWLVDMCLKLGADKFVNGSKAIAAYIDVKKFEGAGVQLIAQQYEMPRTLWRGRGLSSKTTVLLPLFVWGREATLELVTNPNAWRKVCS